MLSTVFRGYLQYSEVIYSIQRLSTVFRGYLQYSDVIYSIQRLSTVFYGLQDTIDSFRISYLRMVNHEVTPA
jgi:hypothetical protein